MESVTDSLLRSGLSYDTIIQFGVRIMIIFLVVPIHEYAHAWSAVKLGDDTPRYQGRLTLNPIAHVDIIGAICLLFAGFGWGKPVQIDPRNFREYRKGNALCAAAGPLSNLIVGTGGMIIYKIFWYAYISSLSQTLYWLAFIMYYFTVVNLGLAVFNLIPIPPLDGSKIVSYFAGNKWDGFMYRYQRQISIVFMLLIISGVLDTPLGYIQNGMFWLIDKITFFVDLIGKALV